LRATAWNSPSPSSWKGDERVLEYYYQPNQIRLTYRAVSGRMISVMHTPDFFVLRSDSAGWEECKTDEQLTVLARKSAYRDQTSPGGRWRCQPGEDYAASVGLYYRIRPSSQIDWVLQRNLYVLDDYFRGDPAGVGSRERELVTAFVSANPGIDLDELIRRIATPTAADCVHSIIARKEIYVDLRDALLTNPSTVHIFSDNPQALGSQATRRCGEKVLDVGIGSFVEWAGATWRVSGLRFAGNCCSLHHEHGRRQPSRVQQPSGPVHGAGPA
jgi:putative transposase